MPSIRFFEEDVKYKLLHPRKTSNWLKKAILAEKGHLGELNFIFCSDTYLREINIHYLNHPTFTDIITFDNSDDPGSIQGDIYVSIERVKENALKFEEEFQTELHRVLVHGVLHLLGYSDKGKGKRSVMKKKEDAYLSLRL